MVDPDEHRAAAQSRLELLDTLVAALRHRDEVLAALSDAADAEDARDRVKGILGLTKDEHATAVLDMQFRRLTKESERRIVDERQALLDQLPEDDSKA